MYRIPFSKCSSQVWDRGYSFPTVSLGTRTSSWPSFLASCRAPTKFSASTCTTTTTLTIGLTNFNLPACRCRCTLYTCYQILVDDLHPSTINKPLSWFVMSFWRGSTLWHLGIVQTVRLTSVVTWSSSQTSDGPLDRNTAWCPCSWFGDSICAMANCVDVAKEVVIALTLALPWQAFAEPSVQSGYMGGCSTGCTQVIIHRS